MSHSQVPLRKGRNFFLTTPLRFRMKNLALFLFLLALPACLSAQSAWELWFGHGATRHHALLWQDSRSAKWMFRVKFTDPKNGQARLIEQVLTADRVGQSICLRAQSVKDLNLGKTPKDYNPDNLYFYESTDNKRYFSNIDNGGQRLQVAAQALTLATFTRKIEEFSVISQQ